MTTSHAISVDRPFAIHPTARSIFHTLKGWFDLQSSMPGAVQQRSFGAAAPDYFKGASDRVCMSAPVTSFRDRF